MDVGTSVRGKKDLVHPLFEYYALFSIRIYPERNLLD